MATLDEILPQLRYVPSMTDRERILRQAGLWDEYQARFGTSGDGGIVTPESPTIDFAAEAAARFPWLTGGLLDTYADLWEETGQSGTALTQLRQTGLYDRTFKGIKRDDGTLRMDENQYLSTVAGYEETLAEFEMNPADWRNKFSTLITNEVDAQEFFQAVGQGYQRFREPGAPDNGLLAQYVARLVDTGSAEAALEDVRASDAYRNVFAGNVRADGTLRMDEPEYFAYKRGWQRLFLSRGLSPEPFQAKNRLVEAIEAEVSIQELDARMNAVEESILSNRSEVSQFFVEQYGEGVGDFLDSEGTMQSALAMALDPAVGNELLSRRISAAQIGGEAAVAGFRRSVERAEELARAGLGQSQARSLYGEAAARLPGLSATTRRFNRGDTSIGDYESALALGDAQGQLRLTRALQSESAQFGARSDIRRSRDGAGLTGLRQR